MVTIDQMKDFAIAASLTASAWLYENNYVGGHRTISRRAPDDLSRSLSGVRTWDYANVAKVSLQRARRHLRKLAAEGVFSEEAGSCALNFRLNREDSDRIGWAIIKRLKAEGLQFDDDWRSSKTAKEST